MDVTRYEISLTSKQNRNDPTPFKTAMLSVRSITPDPLGWPYDSDVEFVVRGRRVARENIASTLDALHAKYPGCSHREHSTLATFMSAPERSI